MLIIQCNMFLKNDAFTEMWRGLVKMAESGVVLLPIGCTLVNEVPPDTEVVAVRKKEG